MTSPDAAAFGQLPLAFEANQGQVDAEVKFLARTPGNNVFLTSTGAVFALRSGENETFNALFHLKLHGASPLKPMGLDELPGKANYFIGNKPSEWHTGLPTYQKVKSVDAYPAIDLIYYGKQRQLEYDWVIRPGGDPTAIRWTFEGAEALELDRDGNLLARVAGRELKQLRPRAYQRIGDQTREVESQYVLAASKELGFHLGEYDRSLPVVIDPVLLFSTFIGGSGADDGRGIAADASGVYVVGATASANFPLASPAQPTFGGNFDAFVLKLNPAGTALIYSTYLGGSGADYGNAIAVDGSGNAYVTGYTLSSNFPVANPLQGSRASTQDAFVTKLSASGTLVYSTYLGGNDTDYGRGIAVDNSGSAYVVGSTISTNFPTVNAYQSARSGDYDAFVSKLNPTGSGLVYSTYLGGTIVDEAFAVAVDGSGAAYVTGYTTSTNFPVLNAVRPVPGGSSDAFVAKLNPSGPPWLAYSTYLGGAGADFGRGIAVDSSGSAVAVGQTGSSNFPVANAFQPSMSGSTDAFVTKLSPAGSAFVYSTFLGGSGVENGNAVAVDSSGNAFVTGDTLSTNFPVVGSLQNAAGDVDAFVTELNPLGSALTYSTYLGGADADSAKGIAVDSAGNAYITGQTRSSNFPTFSALQATYGGALDAFVAKVGGSTAVLLSSVSPNTGPSTGGTSITLRGGNFVAGATATLGSIAATNVVVSSGGTMTANAPAHSAGSVDVVVTNPNSQTSTLTNGFTYVDPPPSGDGSNGSGKKSGCGASGPPIGLGIALAASIRRFLRNRRHPRQRL